MGAEVIPLALGAIIAGMGVGKLRDAQRLKQEQQEMESKFVFSSLMKHAEMGDVDTVTTLLSNPEFTKRYMSPDFAKLVTQQAQGARANIQQQMGQFVYQGDQQGGAGGVYPALPPGLRARPSGGAVPMLPGAPATQAPPAAGADATAALPTAGRTSTQQRLSANSMQAVSDSRQRLLDAQAQARAEGREPITQGVESPPYAGYPPPQVAQAGAPAPQAPQARPEDHDFPPDLLFGNFARPGDVVARGTVRLPGGGTIAMTPTDLAEYSRRVMAHGLTKGYSYGQIANVLIARELPVPADLDIVGNQQFAKALQGRLKEIGVVGDLRSLPRLERADPVAFKNAILGAWTDSDYIPKEMRDKLYPTEGELAQAAEKMYYALDGMAHPLRVATLRAKGLPLTGAQEERFGGEFYAGQKARILQEMEAQGGPRDEAIAANRAYDVIGRNPRIIPKADLDMIREKRELDLTKPGGVLTAMGENPPTAGEPVRSSVRSAMQIAQQHQAAQLAQQEAARVRARVENEPLTGAPAEKVTALLGMQTGLADVMGAFDPSYLGKGFTADQFRKAMGQAGQQAERGQYDGAAFGYLRQATGNISPREVQFRVGVQTLANQLLYAYSGKQINESEFKRLSATLMGLWDEPGVFVSKAAKFQRDLSQSIGDTYKVSTEAAGSASKRYEQQRVPPPTYGTPPGAAPAPKANPFKR